MTYLPKIICSGKIASRCSDCKDCIADWVKEEAIRQGRRDDGLRNTMCSSYNPVRIHIEAKTKYTAETENS